MDGCVRARSRTPTLHARCVVRRARAADPSFPRNHGAGHIEQAGAFHLYRPRPVSRQPRVHFAGAWHGTAQPCRAGVLQGPRELVKNLWLGEQCSKTTVDAAPLFESDSGFLTRRVIRRTGGPRLLAIPSKSLQEFGWSYRTHHKRNIRIHDEFSRRLSPSRRTSEHACKFSPFPSSSDHRIFDRSAGSAIQRLQNPLVYSIFRRFLWANETKERAEKRETKTKGTSRSEEQEQQSPRREYEHGTSSARGASPLCTLHRVFPPLRQLYSTTARAPARAWPAPQCAPAPARVRDSSRWNRVCFAMNASTVRRNSSASSMPQHACASRAVTDDRRRRPFSDSERRSSGDTARRARLAPIFSDLLRRGARASLLARTAGLSSNAVPARAGSGATGAAAAAAAASGASMAAGAGAAGVAKEATSSNKVLEGVGAGVEKEGKLALAAAGAACGGGGFAAVALAVLVWLSEETERSCLESAKRRSTMALPRTKTNRALRRSDPARRSTAAAADGTREDDQERKATSARSSPTRSIRYRRRSRSAAPAAAMAVWHRALVARRLYPRSLRRRPAGYHVVAFRGLWLCLGFGTKAEGDVWESEGSGEGVRAAAAT
ncbi:hypothetical protein C2845_PM05G28070 [Panicum miliaceum]|uniref:Uncharacterized protein n=1 Tax=Panicum miliaceum TaxID=4540 RepID=A0A3L6SU24_PANMI|nr:hypothetical protein C2845_PM05G28070 [Panicum miliaceum]